MYPRGIVSLGVVVAVAAACAEQHDEAPSGSRDAAPVPRAPSPTPSSETADTPPARRFVPRCVDGDVREQRHGATCICCHAEFGAAGSVDRSGPPVDRIVVTDGRGDVATMTPNIFANFFRHFAMTPPFRAVIYGPDGRSLQMRDEAPSSDCNACHYVGGPATPLHGP